MNPLAQTSLFARPLFLILFAAMANIGWLTPCLVYATPQIATSRTATFQTTLTSTAGTLTLSRDDQHSQLKWEFQPLYGKIKSATYPIIRLRQGTPFHTWTTPETAHRWIQEPGPQAPEMDYLVREGTGLVSGGFYTSLDGVDSKNYGTSLVRFEALEEILLIRTPGTSIIDELQQALGSFKPETKLAIRNTLRDIGIRGINYEGVDSKYTWINFLDSSAFGHPRLGTLADALPFAFDRITNTPLPHFIEVLLDLDTKLGPGDLNQNWIASTSKNPVAQELLGLLFQDIKLQPETLKQLGLEPSASTFKRDFLIEHLLRLNQREKPGTSTLTQALIRNHPEVFQAAISQYLQNQMHHYRSWTRSSIPASPFLKSLVDLDLFKFAGNQYSIQVAERFPVAVGRQDESVLSRFKNPSLQYQDRLLLAMSYLDYPDLVTEISKGSSEPWNRYGKENFDRYLNFIQNQILAGAPQYQSILELHSALSGTQAQFRGHDILAGGDLYPDHLGGFYRVTETQAKRLSENPLLTIEFKDDPESRAPIKTRLARHWYASIAHFEKLSPFLTSSTLAKLKGAKLSGLLNKQDSVEYQNLNREVIHELVANVRSAYSKSPLLEYQLLMSIHPFGDYNGRTLRTHFLLSQKRILFLTDWNLDLFLDPFEFELAFWNGQRQLRHLIQGLDQELANRPGFPQYFDLPHWFEVLYPHDRPLDVNRMKAAFLKNDVQRLVKEKRFGEIPTLCSDLFQVRD